jgi:hypothetical protein
MNSLAMVPGEVEGGDGGQSLNQLAGLKGHKELAMSANLLAYNQYAEEMRVTLKVGLGRHSSPHHRMAFDSRNEGRTRLG